MMFAILSISEDKVWRLDHYKGQDLRLISYLPFVAINLQALHGDLRTCTPLSNGTHL